MATKPPASRSFLAELAEFFASRPSREELLNYRPPQAVQDRAEELLDKQSDGAISREERRELDEFAYVEDLMRLVKARVRCRQGKRM
jgi:hypothetical protein